MHSSWKIYNTMTITPEIWNTLTNAIEAVPECPQWLKAQARLECGAVSQLPVIDSVMDGQDALPTIEEKVVATDYLDFLREQIELNPRGPQWLTLLKSRLAALEPFVGKQIIVATFHSKPHSATLRILPDTNEIVHLEVN